MNAPDGPFAAPPGGPHPGVVVLHGTDGLGPHHGAVVETLAGEGFAAWAPRWFGTRDRPGWRDLDPGDLDRIWAGIRARPGVDPARIGWVGFSRGGGLAVLCGARYPASRAVVNFFGLTDWDAGYGQLPRLGLDPADPLGFVARLRCPVLSLHGDADTVVPVTDTERLDAACRRFGVPHEVHRYPGVDHSFVWPGNPRYDARAHRDAWERAVAFLARGT